MIRPFIEETVRYGRNGIADDYSRAGEFIYDHPFQWGSKRTGPDLHREGGKRNHLWHYKHMIDPRQVEINSIMPPYPHLETSTMDLSTTAGRIAVMKTLGVPYTKDDLLQADENYEKQAKQIVAELQEQDATVQLAWDAELTAVIAYLQSLGQSDIVVETTME
jgi:cytochrome c oxidase cbb3-type subunit I/II